MSKWSTLKTCMRVHRCYCQKSYMKYTLISMWILCKTFDVNFYIPRTCSDDDVFMSVSIIMNVYMHIIRVQDVIAIDVVIAFIYRIFSQFDKETGTVISETQPLWLLEGCILACLPTATSINHLDFGIITTNQLFQDWVHERSEGATWGSCPLEFENDDVIYCSEQNAFKF